MTVRFNDATVIGLFDNHVIIEERTNCDGKNKRFHILLHKYQYVKICSKNLFIFKFKVPNHFVSLFLFLAFFLILSLYTLHIIIMIPSSRQWTTISSADILV